MALEATIIWKHCLFIESLKDSVEKLLKLIQEFREVKGYKINKNLLYFHTLAKITEK